MDRINRKDEARTMKVDKTFEDDLRSLCGELLEVDLVCKRAGTRENRVNFPFWRFSQVRGGCKACEHFARYYHILLAGWATCLGGPPPSPQPRTAACAMLTTSTPEYFIL